METVIAPDFSSVTTRADGKQMRLPGFSPLSQAPFTSNAEVEAFIQAEAGNPNYWVTAETSKSMTPIRFKLALGQSARLAIRGAVDYAGADAGELQKKAVLGDWWGILNDPTLTAVSVEDPDTIAALGYLVSLGILTEAKRDEILLGVPA